jgi:4-oxalocrotonate tautomerase
MPLVRISLPQGHPPEYRRSVADAVHRALVQTVNVPEDDRFQAITEHLPGDLIIDRRYLGIERSDEALIVQVTLTEVRSLEAKKRLYSRMAELLKAAVGLRPDDLFVNLVEVTREDWSFGKGIAQYAPSESPPPAAPAR